jgi:tol-pal system protein YbgF
MSTLQRSTPLSKTFTLAAGVLLIAALATPRAVAANKDMIQLQVQVQQLQDAVARLQQSNDERMGVLKDLVQQSADSVNKMSTNVASFQQQLKTEQDAQGGKIDQVSGQIQSLNDSLDELKARLDRMQKLMQDIQSQQQSMSATMQGGAAPGAAPAGGGSSPLPPGTESPLTAGQPQASGPATAIPEAASPAAPPADELYKTALGDYMAAKYNLASSEFGDVVKHYPDNPLAGNSYYYQAEIDYRAGRYTQAVKAYDAVIEKYPASNKVPVSRLHKGQALIALKQRDAGVHELRTLIQRFPNSPEAMQARSRLSGMGVPIAARR